MKCGTLVRLSANGKAASSLRFLNQKTLGVVIEVCGMHDQKFLVLWRNKKVWHYRRELAFARRNKCFQ